MAANTEIRTTSQERTNTENVEPAPAVAPRTTTARTDIIRGAAVVIVALVVGGLILTRGIQEANEVTAGDAESVAGVSTQEDEEAHGDDGTGNSTTTTLEATVTSAANVGEETTESSEQTASTSTSLDSTDSIVIVLNAGAASGSAGQLSDGLYASGFQMVTAKNATSSGPSRIFYEESHRATALELGALLGVDESVLLPLDADDPPGTELQGANIVVIVGTDGVISATSAE